MIFSLTAEYALRAVVHLATADGVTQITPRIAESTKIPSNYLSKVLQALRKKGVVNGSRGSGGGFTLNRPPEEITVLEVINAVDPIKRICSCPLGIPSHGSNLCALHKKLDDAIAHLEQTFGDSTIADILANPTQSIPLQD